jgi:Fur family transcriptional regulator, iron response regulator
MKKYAQAPLSNDQIERVLRGAGISPTAQRIAVYRYVVEDGNHPTAEEVKTAVDAALPKISLATVYNTLRLFVHHNLLHECRFPHSDKVLYDDNPVPHHHFIDEETGELTDIGVDEIDVSTHLKDAGLAVTGTTIILTGKHRT